MVVGPSVVGITGGGTSINIMFNKLPIIYFSNNGSCAGDNAMFFLNGCTTLQFNTTKRIVI